MAEYNSVFMLILTLSICYQPLNADCHTNTPARINLRIESLRNSTGHRQIKVKYDNSAVPGNERDTASVDISQDLYNNNGTEILSTTTILSTPPTYIRMPGYEIFPGLGYYKMHTILRTWSDAFHVCQSEGAHLMVINSKAEANVAKDILNRKYNSKGLTSITWSWSGFHDRGVEGEYRTIHGTLLKDSGYYSWHKGQPNNSPHENEPDQDCGTISTIAELNDYVCLDKLPFICEQPI